MGTPQLRTQCTSQTAMESLASDEDAVVTCYVLGIQDEQLRQEAVLSSGDIEVLVEMIRGLEQETAKDPFSEKAQQVQQEIISFADTHHLLPMGVLKEILCSQLSSPICFQNPQKNTKLLPSGRATERLCTFITTGSGTALPIIILPRFIPFVLTPIPRVFVRWNTGEEAVTSCGGLRSGTGFIAYGQQKGVALGFWGIGFTFSIPPFMGMYGLVGYALYATVRAEEIEYYPPNNPPQVTAVYPSDGAEYIPLSTQELSFHIMDLDGDRMSYSVTTEPNIGGGNGYMKPDGFYTISISELESLTTYTWSVAVTDGKDTVAENFMFTTEPVAPIVFNPSPSDGSRYVPLSTEYLSFFLRDFQGDFMDYTVETTPHIGFGSGSHVENGQYFVVIDGLTYSTIYTWFVNVTDGQHWTYQKYSFQMEPKMVFDPFVEGWKYRKNITINHSHVVGDVDNFPVLIRVVDSDLRDKAQDDGDDIVFMDGIGVATRLYHEIENVDGSTGDLVAWVNMTHIDADHNTIFYMYYGNPVCDSQQTPEKVWDSYYIGVWHMNDLTSSIIKDSTGHYNGIKDGVNDPSQTTGKIGFCQLFNGMNKIDCGDINAIDGVKKITISSWYKTEALISGKYNALYSKAADPRHKIALFFCKDYGRFLLQAGDGYDVGMMKDNRPEGSITGYWYLCNFLYNGDGVTENEILQWYSNDMMIPLEKYGSGPLPLMLPSTTAHFIIAQSPAESAAVYPFSGTIDELRISKTIRSSPWIITEYHNQNNPSEFLSFGQEETHS